MAYTTEQDLIDAAGGAERLDELLSRPAPDGVADGRAYWLAKAQVYADTRINAYLPPRYGTPLAVPSPFVVRLAGDEAVYWLRQTANVITGQDIEAEHRRTQELRDIRDGKIWSGDPLPEQTSGGRSVFVRNARNVNHCNLRGILA